MTDHQPHENAQRQQLPHKILNVTNFPLNIHRKLNKTV